MTRLLMTVFGAFIGFGVWIIGLTVTGHPIIERLDRPASSRLRAKGTALARGVVVGAGAAAVTRWWALLPLVVVGTMMFSGRFARQTTAA